MRFSNNKNPAQSTIVRGGGAYIKAYHNAAGRNANVCSVDADCHGISITPSLVQGQQYTIIVGARSTDLLIHNILMFPCEGTECNAWSGVRNAGVNRCKNRPVGSTVN